MNGSSIFKRRSKKHETSFTTSHQHEQTDPAKNMRSIFRKRQQQEGKTKSLMRLFGFMSRKESFPSLTQQDFTWSLSDDSSQRSVGTNMSCSNSWGFMSCSNSVVAPSPLTAKCVVLERKKKKKSPCKLMKPSGSISPCSSLSSVQSPDMSIQEELVALQETLNEFQKNECEYRTICDAYEAFVQEQDSEIEKKETKIRQLKQLLEAKDSTNVEETEKCEDLQQKLSDCQALCAEHERTIRAKDLKVSKRERELQQQKRVYATLVLQSQAAIQELQETIAAHESHIQSLKAKLDAASKREGLQILQIETFNQELDAVSERYRLDSAKAEEKSQENKRRWTMYEKSI